MACALRSNANFKFPFTPGTKTRPTYWNNFLLNLRKYTLGDTDFQVTWKESAFAWQKLPLMTESCTLDGYFQSYKYFDLEWSVLKWVLSLESQQDAVLATHGKIYIVEGLPTIAMHFRMGDYAQLPDHHPIMPFEYYSASLALIAQKCETANVLYFCEQENSDDIAGRMIEPLKMRFPAYTFIKVSDSIPDWQQMLLMSCCNHHVIANSTFSWWGAYMCGHKEKIVCYPSMWFGPKLKTHDTKDLCPDNWCRIKI